MLVLGSVSNNDRLLVWPSPWCVKGAPLVRVIKAYLSYCVKVYGAEACFFLKKELSSCCAFHVSVVGEHVGDSGSGWRRGCCR